MLLLPALLGAGIGHSEPVPETLAIEAQDTALHPLDLPTGTYVRGMIDSPDGPVTVRLTDGQGAPVRLLVDAAAGQQSFHFIAGVQGKTLLIANPGPARLAVTLSLDLVVPPEAQTGAPDRPLSPRIAALKQQIMAGGDTAAFWSAVAAEGTPLVEPSQTPGNRIVTFVWRGAAHNVRLWGAPATDHVWLERLAGSDVWYASFDIPASTRLSYGLAPDVPQFDGSFGDNRRALLATLQADPLNPRSADPAASDIWARRSLLELPDAPEQPGLTGPLPEQRGTIETVDFSSAILGNRRRVDIYRPAVQPDAAQPVLLILFDGPNYQSATVPLPAMLDRLIAAHRLPPVVVAFVDPVDSTRREAELTCNPAFAEALATELKPLVEARIGLEVPAARTVVAGSSYGGLASACAALVHPAVFGNVIALSGSFWWAPKEWPAGNMPWMSAQWAATGSRDVRFWMSAGIFEAARDPLSPSILETTRHLRDTLQLLGQAEVIYREYAGGHDYLIWRGAIAEGLIALFRPG